MALDIIGAWRYPPPRPEWLAREREPILEPDLPIVDAHHHLWEQEGNLYLLDEFAADLATGHKVEATVFVQAHYGYLSAGPEMFRCVGETEKVEAMAGEARRRGLKTDVAAAIVGFADLTLGDGVAPVLEAHLAASPTRFRGIRHSVSRDTNFPNGIVLRPAPAGLLADTHYRAGLATVARYGLSYDAMLYHQQVSELAAAARAVPALPIVLDHFGCLIGVGPYRGREQATFDAWRRDMADLAACPNVSVKLGGMGMIINGATWHERERPPHSVELADAWRPHVETCIELFGVRRCLFESNFPVDKGMFSYAALWNAFKRLTVAATAEEKEALFSGTARRFYRI